MDQWLKCRHCKSGWFVASYHLVLSVPGTLPTAMVNLLHCFFSVVMSLSSASFVPVISCISSINLLLGRPLLLYGALESPEDCLHLLLCFLVDNILNLNCLISTFMKSIVCLIQFKINDFTRYRTSFLRCTWYMVYYTLKPQSCLCEWFSDGDEFLRPTAESVSTSLWPSYLKPLRSISIISFQPGQNVIF